MIWEVSKVGVKLYADSTTILCVLEDLLQPCLSQPASPPMG